MFKILNTVHFRLQIHNMSKGDLGSETLWVLAWDCGQCQNFSHIHHNIYMNMALSLLAHFKQ